MSLWDKTRETAQRLGHAAAARAVPSLAAEWIAKWIDGSDGNQPVSPHDLEAAAERGIPLFQDALSAADPEALAMARAMFGPVLRSLDTIPYRHILECLEWTHPEHVKVLVRHPGWTLGQMQAVLNWLRGDSGVVG